MLSHCNVRSRIDRVATGGSLGLDGVDEPSRDARALGFVE